MNKRLAPCQNVDTIGRRKIVAFYANASRCFSVRVRVLLTTALEAIRVYISWHSTEGINYSRNNLRTTVSSGPGALIHPCCKNNGVVSGQPMQLRRGIKLIKDDEGKTQQHTVIVFICPCCWPADDLSDKESTNLCSRAIISLQTLPFHSPATLLYYKQLY